MARERGAPAGSRYVDQRHYVVPASLAELRGPVGGVVTLGHWMDWCGDNTYDLDDPGDLQVMYRTVLNQATTATGLHRWLDANTLRRIWSRRNTPVETTHPIVAQRLDVGHGHDLAVKIGIDPPR